MTDQEINVAIAEACGWERTEKWTSGWMKRSSEWPEGFPGAIPNYCTDLNAIHKAEQTLNSSLVRRYNDELAKTCKVLESIFAKTGPQGWVFHATARQRAEALLRTIGKWQTTPQPQTADTLT
jgi:hypothetical protein